MTPYRIIVADVMEGLASMADESVQCVATSPPYWGLRDYSVDGQIGLEPTLDAFIEKMVSVFREVRRVLHKTGVCFVNLGDTYNSRLNGSHGGWNGSTHNGGNNPQRVMNDGSTRNPCANGLKPKDLCGVPWRVALALQADGWYLRSAMPWLKRACMPESCRDRPTSAVEYVFMLTKSSQYYWDAEAVRMAELRLGASAKQIEYQNARRKSKTKPGLVNHSLDWNIDGSTYRGGRNYRNSDLFYASIKPPHGLISDANGDPLAMDVNPQAFSEAHFATYPEKLVEPLILAATSAKGCCPECGAGWERVVEKGYIHHNNTRPRANSSYVASATGAVLLSNNKTLGWHPGCKCGKEPVPCVVLDPFSGSGTTGVVALRHNREYIGIELSEEYAAMSRKRIEKSQRPNTFRDHDTHGDAPLFEEIA